MNSSPRFAFSIGTTLLVAWINLSSFACVQGATQLPRVFDLQAIDDFLTAQVQSNGRVGMSVAVVKDGRLVLARGYGKRSLENGQPVGTDTLFAIGSVTKQFTCACIFLLAEEGKLSVHDKVGKYFPELARADEITLLDLMSHTSGYPDYYPLDFVDRRMREPITPAALIQKYSTGKLDFEPGTKYSYSNTGFILLGYVIEKISSESFRAFLERRILKPLGMEHTAYEPALTDARLARGYASFALSPPETAEPEARGWIGAAGGIYSTPIDLAKWDLALIEGRVLKPESYRLMISPRQLSGGNISEYGCGIGVRTQDGRLVLRHTGAVSGFAAYNAVIPSTRSAVVMLANKESALGPIPSQLLALLLKDESNIPIVAAPPAAETVKTIFAALQSGKVDRSQFGAEFNHFLSVQRLAGASKRLKRFGAPQRADVVESHERGGMEVTVTRLTFKAGVLNALMYRQPDGTIEQFFVDEN